MLQETAKGFRTEIPPMRRPVAIFFYLLFIAFSCTVGFIFVSRSEGWRTGYGLLVTLSLACFGIYGSLQELFGVEVIEWDGQLLRVQDKVSGFNRKREFDIDLMKNLRFGSSTYWQGNTYVMSSGRIQFEYRSKMVTSLRFLKCSEIVIFKY